MSTSIQQSYPLFNDVDGLPLESGYIYIGLSGLNPEANPKAVFSDSALAVPIAQPVRTIAGYPSVSGTPTVVFTDSGNYSVRVKNKNGQVVYTNLTAAPRLDASFVGYTPPSPSTTVMSMQDKASQTVDLVDFGADPTGVADSTTEINAALAYGAANGVKITGTGTFYTSGKVTISGAADFSNAIFEVHGSPALAIEVSTGSATDPLDYLVNPRVYLPKSTINIDKPGTGWAGQGVGVRTVNCLSGKIYPGNIKNFAVGLTVTSFTAGNSYNDHFMGHLENNKVNLLLEPGNTGAWTNENNFIGGRYSHNSAEGTSVSGVRHIKLARATNTVNNNLFVKPSVEGDVVVYNVECGGSANTFLQARWESTVPQVQYIADNANQANDNLIISGFNAHSILVSYISPSGGGLNNQIIGARADNYMNGSSTTGLVKAHNANSSTVPIYVLYEAGTRPEEAAAGEWSSSWGSQFLNGKQKADTYARVNVDFTDGHIYMGDGGAALTSFIGPYGGAGKLQILAATSVRAGTDNNISWGEAGARWSEIFAGNGTINTSDEREKSNIQDLDAAEKAVAVALKELIKKFQFTDSIAKKGDKDARIHVGVAQDVVKAFRSNGLDPFRYGIVCYDEWDETINQNGKESHRVGNRYGIRYDQLLAFIISAI